MSSDTTDRRDRLADVGEIAAEIAHELRNLLQVISSSAYVAGLAVDRGDAEQARPHLARIEKNARSAHAVVDDLMALARGEQLTKEAVPLTDLVAAARNQSDLLAARWDDSAIPADMTVLAHPRLFALMLHAIYENAIHASAPREPTVSTRAHSDSGHVVVEIADDGPGVPASIAEHVFEPLVTGRPEGTGFGLALAKRIVVAHGGSIALLLADHPRGATFRVELPKGE